MKDLLIRTKAVYFIFLVLFFLLVCLTPFVISDETPNPVSVTTRITPESFTLGDIATYTISVQADSDIHPSTPDFMPPKGLELIGKGHPPPRTLNGQTIHEYWYELQVDDIGKLTIPPISLFFKAPDQKEAGKTIQGTILAPEANLEVQSLLEIQENPEGIRDIKPLEEISPPWIHYLWAALGVLCLIGLFYYFWRRWKSRPSASTNPTTSPDLTPEQLAYKSLEALRVKGWLQIGRTQDHFFELSEIFRQYLENRYQFPAREWTTEEISAHFKNFSKLSENLKNRARTILTQTDQIKFAKAELTEGQVEIKTIINFIREACPQLSSRS
jgi:hypothetical protein